MKIKKSEFYRTELGQKTIACIKGLEMHLKILNSKGYLGYMETLCSSELWLTNATELYEKLKMCCNTIDKFYNVKSRILQQGDTLSIFIEGDNGFLIGGIN